LISSAVSALRPVPRSCLPSTDTTFFSGAGSFRAFLIAASDLASTPTSSPFRSSGLMIASTLRRVSWLGTASRPNRRL